MCNIILREIMLINIISSATWTLHVCCYSADVTLNFKNYEFLSVSPSLSACLCLSLTERERERERERENEREREREKQRQTETESLPQIGLTPFLHKPPPEKPYQRIERFIISSYTAI